MPPSPYDELVAKVREAAFHLDKLEQIMGHQHLLVADLILQAKEAYEKETGVGRGKRNPAKLPDFPTALGTAIGKEETWVRRYITIARLDDGTRKRISGNRKLCDTQSLLLQLARLDEPERRLAAIEVYERGGRTAFDAFLTPRNISEELNRPIAADIDDPRVAQIVFDLVDAKAKRSLLVEAKSAELVRHAGQVMDYLRAEGSASARQVREHLGLSKQRAKKILSSLVKTEHVECCGRFTGADSQTFAPVDEDVPPLDARDFEPPRRPIVIQFPTHDELQIPGGRYEARLVSTNPLSVELVPRRRRK